MKKTVKTENTAPGKPKKNRVLKAVLWVFGSIAAILVLLVVFDVFLPAMTADKEEHWENLLTTTADGTAIPYKAQKVTKWDIPARFTQRFVSLLLGDTTPNSYQAKESVDSIRNDGVRVITNIKYADKYPNSYLDIYLPREEWLEANGGSVPVFVYFHGGGFLFGSKSNGDPLASSGDSTGNDMEYLFSHFLENGIAVVSGEYAFSPEYRCPVQIEQYNQLLDHLTKNASSYQLDMTRIILGGSSAGADMTEIYGLFLSNREYASKFDFAPSIDKNCVKGLIIDEAALNLREFTTAAMQIMLGAWVGESDLGNGQVTDLVDVPEHITDSYYPTFVTGSNAPEENGRNYFAESAYELKEKLDEIGVRCECYVPPMEYGAFGHGFLAAAGTRASDEGLAIMCEFVGDILAVD